MANNLSDGMLLLPTLKEKNAVQLFDSLQNEFLFERLQEIILFLVIYSYKNT